MITNIDLRSNCIGTPGLRALLDALQYSRTMVKMELSGNLIHQAVSQLMTKYQPLVMMLYSASLLFSFFVFQDLIQYMQDRAEGGLHDDRTVYMNNVPRAALQKPVSRPKSAPPRYEARSDDTWSSSYEKHRNQKIAVPIPATSSSLIESISKVVLNSAPSYSSTIEPSTYSKIMMVRPTPTKNKTKNKTKNNNNNKKKNKNKNKNKNGVARPFTYILSPFIFCLHPKIGTKAK
jgi:hypothetical protein